MFNWVLKKLLKLSQQSAFILNNPTRIWFLKDQFQTCSGSSKCMYCMSKQSFMINSKRTTAGFYSLQVLLQSYYTHQHIMLFCFQCKLVLVPRKKFRVSSWKVRWAKRSADMNWTLKHNFKWKQVIVWVCLLLLFCQAYSLIDLTETVTSGRALQSQMTHWWAETRLQKTWLSSDWGKKKQCSIDFQHWTVTLW